MFRTHVRLLGPPKKWKFPPYRVWRLRKGPERSKNIRNRERRSSAFSQVSEHRPTPNSEKVTRVLSREVRPKK